MENLKEPWELTNPNERVLAYQRKRVADLVRQYQEAWRSQDFLAAQEVAALAIQELDSAFDINKYQVYHFGGCPYCGWTDGCLSIERDHWFFCERHKVKWWAGSNIFSSWRDQNEEIWRQNSEVLSAYKEVECTFCLERSREDITDDEISEAGLFGG